MEQNTFLKEGVEHTDCRPAARERLLPQKEGAGVFLFTVREGNRVDQAHLAELNGQAKHRRKWKGSTVVGSAPRAISKHPEVQRARRWLQDETPTFNNAQAMSTEQLQEGSRERNKRNKYSRVTAQGTKTLPAFSSLKFQGGKRHLFSVVYKDKPGTSWVSREAEL